MGPDNAKRLMLPVKSGLHYLYLFSERVQAYSIHLNKPCVTKVR